MTDRAHDPRVPWLSVVFGFGPMLPLVAAGAGAWALPMPWPLLAVRAGVGWGGAILIFIAGVRRGFGFGSPGASTPAEVAAMLLYFVLALAALAWPAPGPALTMLALGYALVALFDRRAALAGNAPAHFARLRPPQMALGVCGLLALLARVVAG